MYVKLIINNSSFNSRCFGWEVLCICQLRLLNQVSDSYRNLDIIALSNNTTVFSKISNQNNIKIKTHSCSTYPSSAESEGLWQQTQTKTLSKPTWWLHGWSSCCTNSATFYALATLHWHLHYQSPGGFQDLIAALQRPKWSSPSLYRKSPSALRSIQEAVLHSQSRCRLKQMVTVHSAVQSKLYGTISTWVLHIRNCYANNSIVVLQTCLSTLSSHYAGLILKTWIGQSKNGRDLHVNGDITVLYNKQYLNVVFYTYCTYDAHILYHRVFLYVSYCHQFENWLNSSRYKESTDNYVTIVPQMHLFITAPLLCKIQRSLAHNSFPNSYFLLPRSYWDSFVVLRDSNVCHHDYLFKYSEYENNSLIIMSPFIIYSFNLTNSIFWFVVIYNFSKKLNMIKHNNSFSTSLCVMTGSFWFCMAIYHAQTWQDSIEIVFIWNAPKTQQTTGNLYQQFVIRHPLSYHCKIFTTPSAPGQRGRHFKDDIFRCIFVNEKSCILIEYPKGPIDNNAALV